MIETFIAFLAEHYDLIKLLFDAIENKGLTKAQAVEAIQKAMVSASDAQMQAELGK